MGAGAGLPIPACSDNGHTLELLATPALVVEAAYDAAQSALLYLNGKADFADLMILAAAKRADALPLHTFDRRLASVDGASLIETA